jgi:acyl CoA:acetate/3-ketoacid CoA transferase beta subunit
MENVYGALAARRGAIVTVEKVVDAAMIREHAHLVRLPSSAVAAVVESPLGGHPGGVSTAGLSAELGEIEPYGDDYEFWAELRGAGRDPASMDDWIRRWVLDVASHDAYRALLGSRRIEKLRVRGREETWREDLDAALSEVDFAAEPTPEEHAVVAASRVLQSRFRERGYRTLLAGAGMSNLAAWLAAYALAEDGVSVDLAAEMGLVGYWPHAGEPMLFNQRNFPTCTMLADIDWTMSIVVGGANARAIGALGAAQVDRHANINSTLIPGERLLMGSGGANDVATCAAETVVAAVQTRDRFPEQVPYVTAPGDRIGVVVSQCGVYEKDDGELVLTAVYRDDVDADIREARERCGWDLRVARALRRVDPPTREELLTLRLMDPHGWFRT